MTGFNYQGVMKKNDVLNYPIQGSAFHCLLWSIIQGIKVQVKEKWKSRLVSQIHDAIVMDVHPDELEHVVKTMKRIMCEDIVKHWGWITVPLDVDVEIHNVNDSWADKPQR
jgi:DNA polymerase-1